MSIPLPQALTVTQLAASFRSASVLAVILVTF